MSLRDIVRGQGSSRTEGKGRRLRRMAAVAAVVILGSVAVAEAQSQDSAAWIRTQHTLSGIDGVGPRVFVNAGPRCVWGITLFGGFGDVGTLFTMCHGNFSAVELSLTEGRYPNTLIQDDLDGWLWGTTLHGGASDMGTVFIYQPGHFRTLHSFSRTDGGLPLSLIDGLDGFFYGTTWSGGVNDAGTVFKMDRNGTVTTLHSFSWTDGIRPTSLIKGSDGSFYGTTLGGGASDLGTVFKMDASGTLTTLHSFSGTDGAGPSWSQKLVEALSIGPAFGPGLIKGSDGSIYGMTDYYIHDANAYPGTIFKIDPSGTFASLHSFGPDCGGATALVAGGDGWIYGSSWDCDFAKKVTNSVFKMDASGTLTTLYSDSGLYFTSLIWTGPERLWGTRERSMADQGTVFEMVNVSGLYAQLDAASQTIAGLSSEVAELTGQVGELQGQVSGLTTQVATLTSQNASLQSQLDQLNGDLSAGLLSLQGDFRTVFRDPTFTIPGSTNVSQYQNLIQTILSLRKGEKKPIYNGLLR